MKEEINKMLNILDVCSITRQLCEHHTGEKYAVIYEPIKLLDGDIPREYKAVVACKVEDIRKLEQTIITQEGHQKENFYIGPEFCHIATYDKIGEELGWISFDKNDGYSVQAQMDGEYEYVRNFFEKFLKFRNHLMANGELVKEDDIHQFFTAVIEKQKKSHLETPLNKVKLFLKNRKKD